MLFTYILHIVAYTMHSVQLFLAIKAAYNASRSKVEYHPSLINNINFLRQHNNVVETMRLIVKKKLNESKKKLNETYQLTRMSALFISDKIHSESEFSKKQLINRQHSM